MPATFVVVPQWQGSGSSRALRLVDGAEAIRGDLPSAATHLVDIPMEAGEALETGVRRYSALTGIRRAVSAELAVHDPVVITIGGDGAADLAGAAAAISSRPTGEVAVLWFDAHANLCDAAGARRGAFHRMAARALLGEGPPGLVAIGNERVSPAQLILAGTRAIDEAESAFAQRAGIRILPPEDLRNPAALLSAIEATGARAVYVHIDLDVLDPGAISGVTYPEPFGLEPQELCDAIRAMRARFELVGGAITEFAPGSPAAAEADLGTILRIIGALTAPQ